jgi:hypothetical protein
MPTPASAEDIKRWIEELKSDTPGTRAQAATHLGQLGIRNAPIVEALERVASNDGVPEVRRAAESALLEIKAPSGGPSSGTRSAKRPEIPISRAEKFLGFAIGFGGWFLINGVIWLGLLQGTATRSWTNTSSELIMLPINILAPIILGVIRQTRWEALGVLSALAFNLVVALIIGAFFNGVCFVPFFVR